MAINANQLYTLDEAAELLQVSRRTIYRYTRSGQLPAKRLGHRMYVVGSTLLNLPDYEPPSDYVLPASGFELGYLAQHVTGGNLEAMAEMLNDAGHHPPLDEVEPSAIASVNRLTVIDLFARHAGDGIGQRLRQLLSEAEED